MNGEIILSRYAKKFVYKSDNPIQIRRPIYFSRDTGRTQSVSTTIEVDAGNPISAIGYKTTQQQRLLVTRY